MELKRAKEVLQEFFEDVVPDDKFDLYMQINFCNLSGKVDMDGNFTADQLEAIATWMRDPEGVVGA